MEKMVVLEIGDKGSFHRKNTSTTSLTKFWGTLGVSLSLCSLVNAATITADFSQQGTPLSQEDTTNADAYPGTAGSGWKGPWSIASQANSLQAVEVKNDAAMGNHLSIDYDSVGSTTTASVVRRQFDSTVVNTSAPHLIEFSLRLDSATGWSGPSDSLTFYGNYQSSLGAPSTRTWAVQLRANGTWRSFTSGGSGTNPVLTMPFTAGLVYNVSVWVDPDTMSYTYKVVNASDSSFIYQETPIAFTTTVEAQADAGSWVNFQTSMDSSGDAINWSLGDISVSTLPVPEPSAAVMGGLGLLALVWKARRTISVK